MIMFTLAGSYAYFFFLLDLQCLCFATSHRSQYNMTFLNKVLCFSRKLLFSILSLKFRAFNLLRDSIRLISNAFARLIVKFSSLHPDCIMLLISEKKNTQNFVICPFLFRHYSQFLITQRILKLFICFIQIFMNGRYVYIF